MISTLIGDALEELRKLPAESVQCVVTSPPYWGLRDYSRCKCVAQGRLEVAEDERGDRHTEGGAIAFHRIGKSDPDCPICKGTGIIEGVKEHQLGLEKTPEEYVAKLVEVFREIRRVLRDDGTLWLVLGDSYYGSSKGQTGQGKYTDGQFESAKSTLEICDKTAEHEVLKPKDLCMIPARVAMALQADGWWIRSDVIWDKKNPMPESCRDRPTKSHDYIFLCARSGKPLYWTHPEKPGIRTKPPPDIRWIDRLTDTYYKEKPLEWSKELVACPDCEGGRLEGWFGDETCETCNGKGKLRRWYKKNLWEGHDYFYDQEAVRKPITPNTIERGLVDFGGKKGRKAVIMPGDPRYRRGNEQWGRTFDYKKSSATGRNIRSVWEMSTQPYPEAHFATFPEELPRTCILAGTSQKGCCPKCSAPWERLVEKNRPNHWQDSGPTTEKEKEIRAVSLEIYGGNQKSRSISDIFGRATKSTIRTIGWQPTCECGEKETVPCVVLDPFAGSGTTGQVARNLGRSSILIELNPLYGKMIADRAKTDIPDIMSFEKIAVGTEGE